MAIRNNFGEPVEVSTGSGSDRVPVLAASTFDTDRSPVATAPILNP